MRLIEFLRRRKLGLPPLCPFEENELGHQDDVAVFTIILGITGLFAVYALVEFITYR